MPGRFDKATRRKICDGLRTGRTRRHSAERAGITVRTFQRWMRDGERNLAELERYDAGEWPDDEPKPKITPFGRFAQSVQLAESKAEDRFAKTYLDACRDDPVWADKWLRRHRPDEYTDQRIEITGRGGGPIEIDGPDPVAELESRIARALARAGTSPTDPESDPGTSDPDPA